MQQTISIYMIAYALMSLFHGPLSDALGRRRVILVGVAGVRARVGWLRALGFHRRAARVPRAAGFFRGRGPHRRPRDHPRLLRRRRSAAAHVDRVDDLRHRARDRADRRRLGRRVRALADDLLAARGFCGGAAAHMHRVVARDASARAPRAALGRRARDDVSPHRARSRVPAARARGHAQLQRAVRLCRVGARVRAQTF